MNVSPDRSLDCYLSVALLFFIENTTVYITAEAELTAKAVLSSRRLDAGKSMSMCLQV